MTKFPINKKGVIAGIGILLVLGIYFHCTLGIFCSPRFPECVPDSKIGKQCRWGWAEYYSTPCGHRIETEKYPVLGSVAECKRWDNVFFDEGHGKADRNPLSRDDVSALMCGKNPNGCTIVAECGDLIAIECIPANCVYHFARKTSQELIAECNAREGCKSKLPQEWTCGWPKNVPQKSVSAVVF